MEDRLDLRIIKKTTKEVTYIGTWLYWFEEELVETLETLLREYYVNECTGLKDKNGKLIYFDDFVKLDDGIVCIVKQIDDINDIEYGRVIAIPVFCLNQKYQTRYIPTVIAEGEKIGNLYENPELLEVKNEQL